MAVLPVVKLDTTSGTSAPGAGESLDRVTASFPAEGRVGDDSDLHPAMKTTKSTTKTGKFEHMKGAFLQWGWIGLAIFQSVPEMPVFRTASIWIAYFLPHKFSGRQ